MKPDSWVFRVIAHEGESLGHFLGKFRRANRLSQRVVADHLGVRAEWVRAWEAPSRRRNPTALQLIALSKLTDVEPQKLEKMLPIEPLYLQTRLCAACYGETPVHRSDWQISTINYCELHLLLLLCACPVCGMGFKIPALWELGCCEQCELDFSQMQSYQQPI